MVKCVVFYVHVHVSEICSKPISQKDSFSTYLESQFIFSQILKTVGDCYQPPPPSHLRNLEKKWCILVICNYSIHDNFEICNFFRKHSM